MNMEEKMAAICEIADTKKCIQGWTKEEISKGKDAIDTHELGQAIDMIKDLAEAEKFCMESMYYESVVDAMNDASEEYRMGYGRGPKIRPYYPDNVMFRPMVDQETYIEDWMMDEGRSGYGNGRGGSSGGRSGGSRGNSGRSSGGMSYGGSSGYQNGRENYDGEMRNNSSRYGRAYEDFREARRHYTESGNRADKEEMGSLAQEHVMETVSSMRDIWKSADSDLKTKMKGDLQRLLSEMN